MGIETLRGNTIVVVGVTGQVASPVAKVLAEQNTVIGAARFSNADAKADLEAAGVTCVPIDLEHGDVSNLPADADYVLNFAVAKTNDWTRDLDANLGGTASLIEHHREARAIVHCSSTAVYKPFGHHVFDEDGPLGDNHGVWPFLRTYSTCKIGAEAVARWSSSHHEVPVTIARLSVPYGNGGGWPAIHLEMMKNGSAIPVHEDAPSTYHPIHERDIISMIPGLLDAATIGATTINWGGSEPVSIEQWCTYLGELTGIEPVFAPTRDTIDSVMIDLTRMHTLVGETTVFWKDGMAEMVAARRPELLR